MAQIVTPLTNESQLVLAGEEVIREMPFGNNWTSMRIGIRFAFHGGIINGSNSATISCTTFKGLTIGVCNGPQGWHHDRPLDYVGAKLIGALTNLVLQPYTNWPNWWRADTNAWQTIRKVPSGAIQASTGGGNPLVWTASPRVCSNVCFVNIIRTTATSYSIGPWVSKAVGADQQTHRTKAVFLHQMGLTTVTIGADAGATAVAYSGSGIFTHVAVGWGKFHPQLEISDIAVSRFY